VIPQQTVKRVGAYTRVSTDRQTGPEGSLTTQEQRIRAWLDSRHDRSSWQAARFFREEGRSGKDTDRPELQRLLHAVRAGEINVVICTKIDRFTRSLQDFFSLYQTLQDHGAQFISLDEAFDTTTATGKAMLKIALVFAELERERTSERTKETMAARASIPMIRAGCESTRTKNRSSS
jgi:site-specific DNA recombinase